LQQVGSRYSLFSDEARNEWVAAITRNLAVSDAGHAENTALRDLRGEVSCMAVNGDATTLFVGTTQGNIVRYNVEIDQTSVFVLKSS